MHVQNEILCKIVAVNGNFYSVTAIQFMARMGSGVSGAVWHSQIVHYYCLEAAMRLRLRLVGGILCDVGRIVVEYNIIRNGLVHFLSFWWGDDFGLHLDVGHVGEVSGESSKSKLEVVIFLQWRPDRE
jgi:hypothetical protein